MKKILTGTIFSLFLGLLFMSPVEAGFGISPAGIFNDHLRPGTHFEQEFIVSRSDPGEELVAIIEPDLGEIDAWLSYEPGKRFTLPVGEQRVPFKISIDVPEGVVLKDYQGVIRIKASPLEENMSGVAVVKGARVEVSLIATELSVIDLSVQFLEMKNVKKTDPLRLLMRIANEGNVDQAPTRVEVEIMDLRQNPLQILETTEIDEITAFSVEEVYAEFENTLEVGEYFAYVKVFLNDEILREERLVFKVTGGDEMAEDCIESVWYQFFNQRWLPFLMVFLLILIIYLILRKIVKDKVYDEKQQKLVRLLILVLFLILEIILLIVYFGTDYKLNPFREKCVEVNDVVLQEEKKETTEEVKGLHYERRLDEGGELKVSGPEGESLYEIYKKPDLDSQIIYFAEEGEKFEVLEEKALWYHVFLENGQDGWLSKGDVKVEK